MPFMIGAQINPPVGGGRLVPPIAADRRGDLIRKTVLSDEDIASLPSEIELLAPSRKLIPDAYFFMNQMMIFSQEILDLLHALGDDNVPVHRMKARSRKSYDGQTDFGNYYIALPIPTINDCIIIEETRFDQGFGREGFDEAQKPQNVGASIYPHGPCVFRRDKIAGHHMWRLWRQGWAHQVFVSDEFWAEWTKRKCLGLRAKNNDAFVAR